ncbi:Cysteine-rich membrane protein 2 [Spironucleus salmonicida]|uniref:Cysteine-rich membrane protein 2 n=1 Tax=Spironucleus salmonicida TaxID=348837 RepID=V6LCG9_9EUKA|nr:Cysteine-rich membrane protein 2 [Spironucleus salmonicida]|eukprot:EST41948.1 Cysteine-rich membrane protein 2 [Spironucleus salmonicida]
MSCQIENCQTCEDLNVCTQCQVEYLLMDNKCQDCSEGYRFSQGHLCVKIEKADQLIGILSAGVIAVIIIIAGIIISFRLIQKKKADKERQPLVDAEQQNELI